MSFVQICQFPERYLHNFYVLNSILFLSLYLQISSLKLLIKTKTKNNIFSELHNETSTHFGHKQLKTQIDQKKMQNIE